MTEQMEKGHNSLMRLGIIFVVARACSSTLGKGHLFVLWILQGKKVARAPRNFLSCGVTWKILINDVSDEPLSCINTVIRIIDFEN